MSATPAATARQVDLFDFEDGLIRRLTNWYDIDYARKALQPPSVGAAR
jgi:hypothetical protein